MSESHFLACWLPPFGLPLICETHASPWENSAGNTFDTNVDTNGFKLLQPNPRVFSVIQINMCFGRWYFSSSALWSPTRLFSLRFFSPSQGFSQMQGVYLGEADDVGI